MDEFKRGFHKYEPFGLGSFATDRCYAPHANGRYAALLLIKLLII